jgi:translation initiation factor 5A
MSDEETFEASGSGAADCYPIRAGEIKKGGFVVIKDQPCKVRQWRACCGSGTILWMLGVVLNRFGQVVDVSTSKTGKHGHAKAKIVALNIFNGKKLEEVAPTSHNLFAPNGNAWLSFSILAWLWWHAVPVCPRQ